MPNTLTRMQAVAREWADMPRALVAKRLGLKSPQAVTMRLKRADAREARLGIIDPSSIAQPRLLGRPKHRIELLATYAATN